MLVHKNTNINEKVYYNKENHRKNLNANNPLNNVRNKIIKIKNDVLYLIVYSFNEIVLIVIRKKNYVNE